MDWGIWSGRWSPDCLWVWLWDDNKDEWEDFRMAFWHADSVFVNQFNRSLEPLGCPSHTRKKMCWSVSETSLLGPLSSTTDGYIEGLTGQTWIY